MKRSQLKPSTKPIARRTPLKAVGRRGKRLLALDREVGAKVRSRGFCELKELVPKVMCVGPLQHHHKVKRGVMETRHDEENGMDVCLSHHNWIHHHPAEARKLGVLIDSKSNLL